MVLLHPRWSISSLHFIHLLTDHCYMLRCWLFLRVYMILPGHDEIDQCNISVEILFIYSSSFQTFTPSISDNGTSCEFLKKKPIFLSNRQKSIKFRNCQHIFAISLFLLFYNFSEKTKKLSEKGMCDALSLKVELRKRIVRADIFCNLAQLYG